MSTKKSRGSKSRRKIGKKSRKKAQSRVKLTAEEKAIAMQELGLSRADLSYSEPTWAYFIGGAIILGGLGLSAAIVR